MNAKKYDEDSLVAKVGRRIRALRTGRDMSLRELGKLSGLDPFHVMEVELGRVAATVRTLKAVAGALGVAPADLLNADSDDDAGAVIELMRVDPSRIAEVGALAQEALRLSLN